MIKGIFQLNEKSEIQYTNNFLPEILDCTRKDLIDKPILDLVIGADKLLLENVLMRLHRKEIYSYTNRFQIKPPVGDQYYYLQIELSTLEGKIPKAYVKILGIVSVSEATQYAEEHQLRNTLRYEAVFHNSMDGIFVYNYITEKIEMANNAAAKMLDYDNAKDLVGVSHFKFVPQTSDLFSSVDLYETTKMHGQWVVEGKGFPTQGIFVSKNGKKVLVEARIVPTFYKRGEGIIIFQDVTKRVLGKITKRETEQRYKDIFNNTREAIVYIDIKQTKAILCNERTLELCAVDSLEIFQSIPPEKFLAKDYINGKKSRQYFLDLVAETMKKGRVSTALDFRRQTGEEIRIDVVMVSDTSNPKQPKVIIFGRDISRLHQAQVTLTEKNEELQKYIASNLQLENFAYFASHDLQSPLRSIISFTQLLQHRLRDKTGKSEREYMNFIVSSSKNMKLLIDDLLAFSMVNAG
ncbi:MAG: PAS domain-containing protein, partial [Chitinophagales bacterium]